MRDGHSAGHDAFNRWWEAASWQANHSRGIPEDKQRARERELSHQSTTESVVLIM